MTAASALLFGMLVTGCMAPAPTPTSSPDAALSPTPTASALATPSASPTPTATPTPTPTAAASYDLEAADATCVEYATGDLANMTGTFAPFDTPTITKERGSSNT